MKYFLITFCMIILFSLPLVNAEDSNLSLLVNGKFILPTGDFGKNIGENPHMTRRNGFNFGDNVGLAQMGYGFGIELITPLKFSGLAWTLGSRLLVNGVDGSAVESEFSHQLGDSVNLSFSFGNWLNIPVMTGFRYSYSINQRTVVHFNMQAGINISKAASRKASVRNLTAENTTFSFTRDFGFEVGGGIDFLKSFNLGFRYLNLNSPRYEGTRTLSEKQFPEIYSRKNVILGEERPISMFIVTLGYYLF